MRILLTIALYGVLAGLIATRPRADDIDIYRSGSGPGHGPARVMLALDLRAGAADTLCVDAAAAACETALGDELHTALDLFGPRADDSGRLVAWRSADGVADVNQEDPDGRAESMAAGQWAGVAVDRYDAVRAALRVVLTGLSEGLHGAAANTRVEVGLMALHADDCPGAGPLFSPDFEASPVTGCSQGAYILQGFTDIAVPDNLEKLLLAIAALPDPGRQAPWMVARWQGHPYKIRDAYLELYRYLTGQAVFNGFLGTSDYGSRESGNLYHSRLSEVTNDVLPTSPDGSGQRPLLGPDTDIMLPASLDLDRNRVSGAVYESPIGREETCSGVTMVNLLTGAVGGSRPETNQAIAAQPAAGGLGLDLMAGAPGDLALVATLAAGVRAAGDPDAGAVIPVRSYFLVPHVDAANDAMAVAGGTGFAYALNDPRRMVEALEAVFGDFRGDGKTLSAGATPFNDAAGKGSARDIFFAMFRPEPTPFWPGNLKKLKIVELAGIDPVTGEASHREIIAQAPLTNPPTPAISPDDGQILPDALTFWTDPLGADVLAFDASRQEVSGRDGRSITRGGAGQRVRGFLENAASGSNGEQGARQMYTLDPDQPGALLALDAAPAIQVAISPYLDPADQLTEAQELDLISWIRGQDSFDADGDGDRAEPRSWLLADPLHSRPLAVNYGARPGTAYTAGNPDIRIFFGTNDGVFHVLQNTTPDAAESGRETWAFIPPELLGLQNTLARNRISALQSHPYGLDGEAVSLVRDLDGNGHIEADRGDSVWVFIGQRRGGRGIYAFDMTDPDNPRYMWTIDNSTPGFEQLALTFSTPRVARLDLGEERATQVLVFAGGYNGGWQGPARVGKDAGGDSDPVGNALFVVDPADGRLIWHAVGPDGGAAPESDEQLLFVADLADSIPSPVTVIDSDHNGVDDRAYVGDSGGNLWRIEFTERRYRQPDTAATDASNWYVTRLAALGGAGDGDRRFFHAPDVVQSRDEFGNYDGVVLVSGNRAAPRETVVRNFAYLLKDRRTAGNGNVAPLPRTVHDELADITGACLTDAARECSEADLEAGWKLQLQAPGEKGLSVPLVSNGRVLFTSYVPVAEDTLEEAMDGGPRACSMSEGFGRLYAVKLRNGSPALTRARKFKVTEEAELEEDEAEDEAERFLSIGPGLHGDVVPAGDSVLIPGTGLEEGPLVSVPGRDRWRAYWREEEVDSH